MGTWASIGLQVFATLYVSYRILKTAEENFQELSQHREEHEQVAELTKREASYTRKFLEVSSWPSLPFYIRAMIVTWASLFLIIFNYFLSYTKCHLWNLKNKQWDEFEHRKKNI